MRNVFLCALVVFSSLATAKASEFYEEFQGEFVSVEGDCLGAKRFKLSFDEKKDQVVLSRADGKGTKIIIPKTGATEYSVDKKSFLLTVTSPHLALNPADENEVRFGEKGGKSIYVDVKQVQLDSDLKGNDDEQVVTHTELNLSKDRQTLTYFSSAADFVSDPHEDICTFKRVEKK